MIAQIPRDATTYNQADAARLLGVSSATFRGWLRQKLIPHRRLPNGGGSCEHIVVRVADLIAFAQQRDLITPSLQQVADKHGIGLHSAAVLVLTTDAALLLAIALAGYDVSPATNGYSAGRQLGRKRFDAAIIDSATDDWRSVYEDLLYHAPWMSVGLLTPEDQPPRRDAGALCWQKPVDGARIAAELMDDLRARR